MLKQKVSTPKILMNKQSNKSTNFILGLFILWNQQMHLLVDRIRKLPQNRKVMKDLIVLCIGLSVVVCVGVWAINTGRCANCKRTMGFQNGDLHFKPCWNCEVEVYTCPGTLHPHQKRCDICGSTYWDCPTKSEADKHGDTICEPPIIKGILPPEPKMIPNR